MNELNCISSHRSAGKLFHTPGMKAEKLLSPKVVTIPVVIAVVHDYCDTVNSSYRSDVLNTFLIVFTLICCIIFVLLLL